jgi:hypothetical protein
VQDTVPRFLGRLSKPEQSILRIDDAFIDEEVDVDDAALIGFAYQHHRNRSDFSRLYEG